jgi:hypothetical protein
MRREDFGVALALMLIVSLGMAGGIGEALLGRNAIGCALLGRTAIGRALHAHNATGDLGAGAAPVILEVIPTDKRTHGPAEGLTQDDFEMWRDAALRRSLRLRTARRERGGH